jgi:hypothetical protein
MPKTTPEGEYFPKKYECWFFPFQDVCRIYAPDGSVTVIPNEAEATKLCVAINKLLGA